MADKKRRRRVSQEAPVAKRGRLTVTRTYTIAGEIMSADEAVDDLEVRTFSTEPAQVSIAHGCTVNLGDFEFARLDVQVSIPCYAEEVDEALLNADATAHKFLEESITEYVEELR